MEYQPGSKQLYLKKAKRSKTLCAAFLFLFKLKIDFLHNHKKYDSYLKPFKQAHIASAQPLPANLLY